MPEVSWKVWEELRNIRKRCKDGGELGVIESSKIRVYSGSLAGKEKFIRKIDRHKRKVFGKSRSSERCRKYRLDWRS